MPTEPTHTPLKPCPFCGSEATTEFGGSTGLETEETAHGFYIQCKGRNCYGVLGYICECDYGDRGAYKTKAEAIAAWNTRAPSPVTALRAPGGEQPMKTPNTDAPWKVLPVHSQSRDENEDLHIAVQTHGVAISLVFPPVVGNEEGEKVARLIASAPALLAALQGLIEAERAVSEMGEPMQGSREPDDRYQKRCENWVGLNVILDNARKTARTAMTPTLLPLL